MRIGLSEIERLIGARESFAVETTLAPRSFEKRTSGWKAAGYHVRMYLVYLADANVSVQRVSLRVARGEHHVPEEIVRRRYEEGLKSFFTKYRHLVNEWQFIDNTKAEPRAVALASSEEGLQIVDRALWVTLERRYVR